MYHGAPQFAVSIATPLFTITGAPTQELQFQWGNALPAVPGDFSIGIEGERSFLWITDAACARLNVRGLSGSLCSSQLNSVVDLVTPVSGVDLAPPVGVVQLVW